VKAAEWVTPIISKKKSPTESEGTREGALLQDTRSNSEEGVKEKKWVGSLDMIYIIWITRKKTKKPEQGEKKKHGEKHRKEKDSSIDLALIQSISLLKRQNQTGRGWVKKKKHPPKKKNKKKPKQKHAVIRGKATWATKRIKERQKKISNEEKDIGRSAH